MPAPLEMCHDAILVPGWAGLEVSEDRYLHLKPRYTLRADDEKRPA